MDPTTVPLHMYFLQRLVISIAFLIPLIVTWWLKSTRLKDTPRPLTYILIGFAIGFLANIIIGLLGAYVFKLPLLPLLLYQKDLPMQYLSHIVFIYNTIFNVAYVASLFASLLLVTYGMYKLALWSSDKRTP
ncbi:MAG: hypothetical protein DRN04_00325 [Thermoprotei archaeon]|nr:MAG: hypothetical protein DRN04_00325 [Thermoprotei archaeon]